MLTLRISHFNSLQEQTWMTLFLFIDSSNFGKQKSGDSNLTSEMESFLSLSSSLNRQRCLMQNYFIQNGYAPLSSVSWSFIRLNHTDSSRLSHLLFKAPILTYQDYLMRRGSQVQVTFLQCYSEGFEQKARGITSSRRGFKQVSL